jgi:nicotinamide riboside kinase
MLKIALLGAPRTGKSLLASGLNSAAQASAWPATVVVLQAQDPALPMASAGYDLVLLTGLEDAPAAPHGDADRTPVCPQAQEMADSAIRAALTRAKISYRVLYGRSSERLAQACEALQSLLPAEPAPAQPGPVRARKRPTPWVWPCEKCSDPQCEHRLLTALLAQRARRA